MAPRGKTMKQIRASRNNTTKKAPKATLSAPVKRAVTAIVKGQQETKYAFGALNSTSFNSAITNATTEWFNCLPDVPIAATGGDGSQPWQRDGVRIQPTSLKLNWCIGFNPEVSRTCDNYVVLYVFKMRRFKTFADMKANGNPALFLDQGVGGKIGFDGYTQQLITPINREQFVLVHRKVIHLQKGVGLLNNQGATSITEYAGNGNKTAQMVSFTVKNLPKLIYDDADNVVQPNNYGLVWALGYAHTDMTTPDNLYQDIQVTHTSQLYYKDS